MNINEQDLVEIEKTYCCDMPKKHYNRCYLVNHKCAIHFLINKLRILKEELDKIKKD